MANYEHANKRLDTAKNKNKGVHEAEANQQTCKEKFDKLSEVGKEGKLEVYLVKCLSTYIPVHLLLFPLAHSCRTQVLQGTQGGHLQEESCKFLARVSVGW